MNYHRSTRPLTIALVGVLALAALLTVCITVYLTNEANKNYRHQLVEMCLSFDKAPIACLDTIAVVR